MNWQGDTPFPSLKPARFIYRDRFLSVTVKINREAVHSMRDHEQGMEIPSQYLPKCPVCGGPMQLHVPVNQAFVKDREWQMRYQDYQAFIKRFHGKKLLILEFGVGARNQMMKTPFMKLAYAEPDAFYITCLGLVEQNYELPEEVLHQMGVETIPVPRTRVERIDVPFFLFSE